MSQQINIRVLEGVAKRFELALRSASGTPLPAAEWQLGGGAENSSGEKVDAAVVAFADGRAVLQLPPLTLGPQKVCKPRREPWGYQLRATELATGRVYVLLQGELTVDPWYGETEPATGMVDAARVAADAALEDAEVVTGTITLGIAGPQGEQGPKGDKGDPGAALTYADLSDEQKEALIAPLGYAEVQVAPEGTTEDNYNAHGFGYVLPQAGRITALDLVCRHSTPATPADAPMWVKVWRGESQQLAAVSANAQVHAVGAVLHYTFATPIEVAAGEELRVSFHAEDGISTTAYQMGQVCCLRVLAKTPATPGGLLGSLGGYGSDTLKSWVPKHTWHMQVERYAPAAHVGDTTAHITAEEHAGLAELLETYGTTGRDVPILNGEAIVQVGHTYVITATGAVTGSCGEAQLTCAAGKQLGFVATTTTATLNGSCSLTELFRPAAAVQLSGAGGGEPEGDYVTVAADSTLTGGRLDTLTSGRYLQYERSTLTSWDIPMPSLITGDRMFYKCTGLARFTSNLTSLQEGSFMFTYSGLTSFACELPSLTTATQMFCACGALRSFDVDLPALTTGNQMFQSSGLQSFTGALPKLQTCSQMFDRCGLRSFSVDLPELQSGLNMFVRCASLQSFSSYLPLMTGGTSMFSYCTALTSFAADLPSLSIGTSMFSSCKLDKASALRVLTTIPTYTSDTHNLTIGIHVDHKTDEEVLAAITAAEGKGWTLTVQWNGTATA